MFQHSPQAAQQSRVIALCASGPVTRQILLAASRARMLDRGEFVFFNVDQFSSGTALERPWESSEAEEEENEEARAAFRHVLTISTLPSNNQVS